MLDIKFIRENPEKVKKGAADKNVVVDIDALLKKDAEHLEVLRKLEMLRAEQNKKSREAKGETGELKAIKQQIQALETDEKQKEAALRNEMLRIPNPPLDSVPVGRDERENVVLREVGEKPKFAKDALSYINISEKLDIIDTERASKVSGSRFGYIKGEAALMELALVRLAFETAGSKGFVPVIPPVLIKPESMAAMGYMERGGEEIYHLEKDDIYLVGTSEQSVGPMHSGETFNESDLPRRYISFSTCFRREAGSYGKDTKGILRVHQFDKVEMFVFCKPEDSPKEHQLLLQIEEELMQKLDIPYRVLDICTGDLGDPAAAKYDIEAWMPGQNNGKGEYRETHSTSNTTDFQARRLGIRFRRALPGGKFKPEFVHTLNGTAFAIGRTLIAIIENYQTPDGGIRMPEALRPYLPFEEIKPR
jgi:seryl-tRNA synthetase